MVDGDSAPPKEQGAAPPAAGEPVAGAGQPDVATAGHQGLDFPKVERMLVARGEWFTVECAVRRDRSSPVAEFLQDLGDGASPVASEVLEKDEQIDWRRWFVRACHRVATTGRPPHGDAHNQLQDGIWELKYWDLRVSFYDTDGSGVYVPLVDTESYSRFTTRPWPEDFLESLRLTTAFAKTGQKTDPAQIALAIDVREEDLEHDRPPEEIAG